MAADLAVADVFEVLRERARQRPIRSRTATGSSPQFAEENDFEAIMAVNRKIRLVCGLAPTDHLKESIPGGD